MTSTWVKFTSREENWRDGTDAKHDVSVLVQWDQVIAMKGIAPSEKEENRTLIFVKASGPNGWLEFAVVETVDEIVSKMQAQEDDR